ARRAGQRRQRLLARTRGRHRDEDERSCDQSREHESYGPSHTDLLFSLCTHLLPSESVRRSRREVSAAHAPVSSHNSSSRFGAATHVRQDDQSPFAHSTLLLRLDIRPSRFRSSCFLPSEAVHWSPARGCPAGALSWQELMPVRSNGKYSKVITVPNRMITRGTDCFADA